MRVLIACEESATVREAFRALGHDAWSCDVVPSRVPGNHIQADVLTVLGDGWDLMIAHPPCDYLTVSGNRWFRDDAKAGPGILVGEARREAQSRALEFVLALWRAPIPKVVIENPIGRLSTLWRKPSQVIQPWQFGHGEIKATCLWLRGLPLLAPTLIVEGREARVHRMPPGEARARERSKTLEGIASAMAAQWGGFE